MNETYGNNPANFHAAITPSDTADIEPRPRGVYVGGAGDVSVIMNGVTVVYAAAAGTILPVRPSRIRATGTTATGLIALW